MNDLKKFEDLFLKLTMFKKNKFHPFVWILDKPKIGKNVSIGGFSEINAKGATISIGDNCDIASFVSINCVDSHKKCIGLIKDKVRLDINIENNCFIGSHSVVKGGAYIGHHSVVAAGAVVDGVKIPPYSLVYGNPMKVKAGYYKHKISNYGKI